MLCVLLGVAYSNTEKVTKLTLVLIGVVFFYFIAFKVQISVFFPLEWQWVEELRPHQFLNWEQT